MELFRQFVISLVPFNHMSIDVTLIHTLTDSYPIHDISNMTPFLVQTRTTLSFDLSLSVLTRVRKDQGNRSL